MQTDQENEESWKSLMSTWHVCEKLFSIGNLPPVNKKLSDELKQFSNELILVNDKENNNYVEKKTHLQQFLSRFLPGEKIDIFGSFGCGLSLDGSDVDIMVTRARGTSELGKFQRACCNEFANLVSRYYQIEDISSLRVRIPVVKVYCPKVQIDVSFNNEPGVHKSQLISQYISFDHRMRELILLIKSWASAKQLTGIQKDRFSSFAWSLMTIYFLQHKEKPAVPNLQDLSLCRFEPVVELQQREASRYRSNKLETINATFLRNSTQMNLEKSRRKWETEKSVPELFREFFLFYSMNFDFTTEIVNIRTPREQNRVAHGGLFAVKDPFDSGFVKQFSWLDIGFARCVFEIQKTLVLLTQGCDAKILFQPSEPSEFETFRDAYWRSPVRNHFQDASRKYLLHSIVTK